MENDDFQCLVIDFSFIRWVWMSYSMFCNGKMSDEWKLFPSNKIYICIQYFSMELQSSALRKYKFIHFNRYVQFNAWAPYAKWVRFTDLQEIKVSFWISFFYFHSFYHTLCSSQHETFSIAFCYCYSIKSK